MKIFKQHEIRQALKYVENGGQALHLHRIIVNRKTAPACFKRDVDAGKEIAHLFDLDLKRLVQTAKGVGVKKILVEREGLVSQHIDLCGKPLEKLMEQVNEN